MSAPFAPPHLFGALAGYSDGNDPETQEGAHLRLLPAPALGFPLAPFGIWPARPSRGRVRVIWTNRAGFVTAPDLDRNENELHGYVVPPSDGVYVAVELPPQEAELSELALVDSVAPGSSRVLAARTTPDWLLAGPNVSHFRVRGSGRIETVYAYWLGRENLLGALLDPGFRPELLGLPLDDDLPWYVSAQGRGAALDRVERGAPQSLGPPDEPQGPPFGSLEPQQERERIEALAPPLDNRLIEMLRDPDLPPRQHRERDASQVGKAMHRIELRSAAALQVQALDPGIGRYLGLMTVPEGAAAGLPCWIAAGVFAFEPEEVLPDGSSVEAALGRGGVLDDVLAHLLGVAPPLERVIAEQVERGRQVRVLLTAAAAPPLPDRPPAPALASGPSQWLLGDPERPVFRQQVQVTEAPLAPLVAFARSDAAGLHSLHKILELPGGGERAQAMLLGKGGAPGVGILSDAPVPEDEGARYAVRLGDLFGRFGEPGEIDAQPPPHPPPPRPAPQATVVRASGLPASGRVSPGTLVVRVPVPPPEQTAPGSRRLAVLRLTLGGNTEEVLPEAPWTRVELPLDGLEPGGELRQTLTVGFRDVAGTESELSREPVRVLDGRPPEPVRSGVAITWTSRPGPSEEVELRLSWPARGNERYRVYIADARALGAEGGTRAELAESASGLGEVGKRELFRLLTDPPLEPRGGRVVLDERLPRSLEKLQLVRVVPVSPGNVEAPFAKCGLVPVAVPSERRPPPPRLTASVDPESGRAKLLISAPGINREQALAAGRPPEYRLRRAIDQLVDPLYARPRGKPGELRKGADESEPEAFAARLEEGGAEGLEPYVRYVYWAEARMPAERRLPPGVDPKSPPDGIAGVENAQREDAPGLFSEPSAHAYAMHVPEIPALTGEHAVFETRSDGGGGALLTMRIGEGPSTHPSAIGTYRLRAWVRQGTEPLLRLGSDATMPSFDGGLEWTAGFPVADPGLAQIGILLAIVDPLDRQGPVTELSTGFTV